MVSVRGRAAAAKNYGPPFLAGLGLSGAGQAIPGRPLRFFGVSRLTLMADGEDQDHLNSG